jgi:hypothetical protein
MCYNAPTSIIYFCIISAVIFYLWRRNQNNDRWFSLIFICINLVQLGEFFIWRYIGNPKMNKFGTKIVKLSIYAQPLALFLGGFLIGNINKKYKKIFNIFVIIYTIIFGIEFIHVLFTKVMISNKLGNHLTWDKDLFANTVFNNHIVNILYFISFLFLFFQNSSFIQSLLIISFLYITFIINYLSLKNDTWKSMWCFLGNFTPIIYLLTTIL